MKTSQYIMAILAASAVAVVCSSTSYADDSQEECARVCTNEFNHCVSEGKKSYSQCQDDRKECDNRCFR